MTRLKPEQFRDKGRLRQRLHNRILLVDGHWLWTGQVHPTKEYGQITVDGRKWGVHRIAAYVYLGLDLDNPDIQALHKPPCNIKRCFNPDHLYIGSNADNRKDVRQFPFKCGHPRTADNIIYDKQWMRCKICRHISDNRRKANKSKRNVKNAPNFNAR